MKKLSWIISALFHPLLLTPFIFLILTQFAPEPLGIEGISEKGLWILTGLIFGLTFVLPMVSIIILRLTYNISDIEMSIRKERYWPMVLTTVYYSMTAYFFTVKNPVGLPANAILAGIFLTLIILTLITFLWQISIHSAAISGIVGILLAFQIIYSVQILTYFLAGSILVAGWVSAARLHLNSHSPQQVWLGALIGFLICFITVFALLGM